MSRAIWKGHISFGLVEIPISLVKAEESHELDLHLVDRRDHAPIGYERKPKEIEMAEQLVASMDAEWDPDRYHDRWFEAVTKLIAKKRKAGETEPLEVEDAPERESTSVVDLMPLLQQSMKSRKPATRKKKATRTRKSA